MNTTQTRVRTYSIVSTSQIQVTSVGKSFHSITIINVNMALAINRVIVDVAINLSKSIDIKKTYHYECRTQCYTFLITNWCANYRIYDCITYSIHHKECRCRPYRHA